MVKAVIFDLDDTLVSEEEYIVSGYREVAGILAATYGLKASIVFQTLITLFRKQPKNVFNRALDSFGITYGQEEILQLVKRYREHSPQISFYEDVIPVVNELKNRGVLTGIISDGYAVSQRKKIESLQAEIYFDFILLTDELGREFWKPASRAFEIMQEKCMCSFDEMLYVGDNPEKDFYISSIYPVQTVRIDRGTGVYRDSVYYKGIKEQKRICALTELLEEI